MEEKKAPRSMDVLRQEYSQMCFKAGELQYTIQVYEKDLQLINEQLRDLNFEFTAAQLADKEAKKAEEAKASEAK